MMLQKKNLPCNLIKGNSAHVGCVFPLCIKALVAYVMERQDKKREV